MNSNDAVKLFSNSRPLYKIAEEISGDWKAVNYAAVPYLEALHCLNTIDDDYGCDSGKSMVAYFLSNAATWRGDAARRIKKELNGMLKY